MVNRIAAGLLLAGAIVSAVNANWVASCFAVVAMISELQLANVREQLVRIGVMADAARRALR